MKGLTRFHIGVIVTGALLCFGPGTMVLNSWSIFMVPVSEGIGVPTNLFSLQPSIIYLACALFSPLAGRLIDRFDLRAVLTAASLLGGAAVALCGLCSHLWQFFALGVLEGFAGVVLIFLMLPNLISRWFAKGMGTVIGVCIALSGAGGALWAYLGGIVIVNAGWRAAYIALGCIALALSLPTCLLLLRNRPSDVGVRPFGEDAAEDDALLGEGATASITETHAGIEASESTPSSTQVPASASAPAARGVSASVAFKSSAFVLLAVAVSLINGIIGVANLLPTYVYHLGDVGAFAMTHAQVVMSASTIALCTQVAQACGKILFGIVGDRSYVAAFAGVTGCGIVAIFCFLLGYTVPAIVFAGGALFGALYAGTDVLGPIMARDFFGDREYSRIYARLALFVNLVPAFSIFLFSSLSSLSWVLAFVLCGACLATSLACGLASTRASRALKAHFE